MFLYQVQYLAEIKNSLKILQKNLSTGLNVFSDKIYGTRSSESFFVVVGRVVVFGGRGLSVVDELGKTDQHG